MCFLLFWLSREAYQKTMGKKLSPHHTNFFIVAQSVWDYRKSLFLHSPKSVKYSIKNQENHQYMKSMLEQYVCMKKSPLEIDDKPAFGTKKVTFSYR
jgi:hypothetical protein